MTTDVLAAKSAEVLESSPSATLLQDQLYRYALDMQELMEQHAKLQTNYKLILQSVGRNVPSDDVLPKLLLDAADMHIVTDIQGIIVRANMSAHNAFCLSTNDLRGLPIEQLFSPRDRALAKAIVEKFASGRPPGGIEQRTFEMFEHAPQAQMKRFDLLIMQMQRNTRRELVWFLKDAMGPILDPIEIQRRFLADVKSEEGLLITDPFGAICSVNSAFCQISGYAEDEVLGKNPRMMSSGRHESSFYQEFWIELLGQGNWCGEIFNRRKNGQIFLEWESIKMVEDSQGNVVSYIATISDLSQKEMGNQELSQLAYHDPLTGLPNRRLLEERMMKAMAGASRDSSGLCTLFVDLDRFKPINDELGHHIGDMVLKEVADRLKQSVRQGDTVARVGGDEFVVLLQNTRKEQDAEDIAVSLLNRLAEPILVGEHTVQVSASVGCSQYPQDGEDIATLLKNADAAMYGAKRFGTQFNFFDTGVVHAPMPSVGFELWGAIERNEMNLLYQPQVEAGGGHLRGCEALLRWTHPVLGDVEPRIFIPIAEKTGSILSIGNWVLEQACQQMGVWKSSGLNDLTLTVNVSLRQLRDPSFAGFVHHCLVENGVEPHALELDFSETDALQYQEEDLQPIHALRNLGIKISIDDFGVAFSSLSKLYGLSISCLKINPEVIRDLTHSDETRAMSRCLVAVAEALDIELVAGGVETREQLRVLKEQGCRVVQGYLTGGPMTAQSLEEFIRQGQAQND